MGNVFPTTLHSSHLYSANAYLLCFLKPMTVPVENNPDGDVDCAEYGSQAWGLAAIHNVSEDVPSDSICALLRPRFSRTDADTQGHKNGECGMAVNRKSPWSMKLHKDQRKVGE